VKEMVGGPELRVAGAVLRSAAPVVLGEDLQRAVAGDRAGGLNELVAGGDLRAGGDVERGPGELGDGEVGVVDVGDQRIGAERLVPAGPVEDAAVADLERAGVRAAPGER